MLEPSLYGGGIQYWMSRVKFDFHVTDGVGLLKVCLPLMYYRFYPRDAMLARVFATATCLSVCLSGRPSHAGIVPSTAKAGS